MEVAQQAGDVARRSWLGDTQVVAIAHCGLEVRARSLGTVRGCPTAEKEINPTGVGDEGHQKIKKSYQFTGNFQ